MNTKAGETAREIYQRSVQAGALSRPVVPMAGQAADDLRPGEASPEIKEFFTLRKAHWPFKLVNTHNEWHWESTCPQVFSYDADPAKA